jgi:hypothetical protein
MFKKFNQNRVRNKLPQEYITKINNDIKKISPEINKNIEVIEIDTCILNSWNKDNLLDIKNEDYLNQSNFKVIDKSCIGICKKTKRLLFYFITNEDDEDINFCLRDAEDVINGFNKYCPKKTKSFYSSFSSQKDKKNIYVKNNKDYKKYSGCNWLDGLQRFFCKFKDIGEGRNYIGYYKMNENGQNDLEWRFKKERLYSLLYHLEKKYVPEQAEYRLKLLDDSYCKGIMPKELNPSTCMGASRDFSSSFHKDSSVKGTMESIIWTGAKQGKQIFVNGAGFYFNINKNSLIFQVGTDYHGTANTGEHGGFGFVNLSKSNLLCNTETTKKLYDNIYNQN